MSWPAQMSKKYGIDVVNLARGGSSNKRAFRIGIEELCRDSRYDYVIFPLAPGSRSEILKNGKWHQIWPGANSDNTVLDKIYQEFWMPWNDLQEIILQTFYFSQSLKSMGIPLYITGLSFFPMTYSKELSWITQYKGDNNFRSLDMPLEELNIGVKDLDRKLKSLQAIHQKNLDLQPEYLDDVCEKYLNQPKTKEIYGTSLYAAGGHPNDSGYLALADYFAEKIGIV